MTDQTASAAAPAPVTAVYRPIATLAARPDGGYILSLDWSAPVDGVTRGNQAIDTDDEAVTAMARALDAWLPTASVHTWTVPAPSAAAWTEIDEQHLTVLQDRFAAAGGRGVEEAEEIDRLRLRRALVTGDLEAVDEDSASALQDLVLDVSEGASTTVLNGGVSAQVAYLNAQGLSVEQILARIA